LLNIYICLVLVKQKSSDTVQINFLRHSSKDMTFNITHPDSVSDCSGVKGQGWNVLQHCV